MNYKDDEFIVYKHTSPSGKSYIGITHQKPWLRWRKDGSGYKHSTVFYRAIQKYGFENFKHEILLDGLTYDEACNEEKRLISKHNTMVPNGYNVDAGGYEGTCFKRKIIAFKNKDDIRLFESISDAASEMNISPSSISHVIETSRKAGGWLYVYAS